MPRRVRVQIVVVALAVLSSLSVRQAFAELIFFSGDRSMSVKSHRFEGDQIIVSLRNGGEMTFDRGLVAAIRPDEVPYDEPAAQQAIRAAGERLIDNTVYEPFIKMASAAHNVDARLVKAVIQAESAYQPRARSRKGAIGLMQLMPKTAEQYKAPNPYDPRANIDAGTKYLRVLLDEFDLPRAIAAYNAGEEAVRRFGGVPPFPETQAYVAKVLSLLAPFELK
jgi:soluble lytic murein transglycosylase-like protein